MDRLYEESDLGFGLKFWVSCVLTVVAVSLYVPFLAWLLFPERFDALAFLNEKPLYGIPFAATLPVVWILLMAKFQEFPRFLLSSIPGPVKLLMLSFFSTALFFVLYTGFFFTSGTGIVVAYLKPGFMLYAPTMLAALQFHVLVMLALEFWTRRRDRLMSRRLMLFR